MVFPFGVSVSDFIAGIKLMKNVIEAMSDTHGAQAEFVQLVQALDGLSNAFDSILKFDSAVHIEALSPTLEGCIRCVAKFLKDVTKYDIMRDQQVKRRRLIKGLRKIEWATCEKERVKSFRNNLNLHLSALEMHLLSFQV